MLSVHCELERKAPLSRKQWISASQAFFSPWLPVDWNTPGLHLQYQLAKASIMRSIFCASPGSRKLHRNCLSGVACQRVSQMVCKGLLSLLSAHETPWKYKKASHHTRETTQHRKQEICFSLYKFLGFISLKLPKRRKQNWAYCKHPFP